MESLDKLQKLMELAKQYGVLRLKTPEFEVEFNPFKINEEPSLAVQPLIVTQDDLPKPELSNEDMLFWSVEEPVRAVNSLEIKE